MGGVDLKDLGQIFWLFLQSTGILLAVNAIFRAVLSKSRSFFTECLYGIRDRIQTCNRLSRNQVFYSVELRGQIKYEVIDIIGF
jgi:hypothetical protein